MLNTKKMLTITVASALALLNGVVASGDTTPREYTGTLQASGTHFDDFLTNSGEYLQVDKNNPDAKLLYKICSYNEECTFFAYVKDDMISKVVNKKDNIQVSDTRGNSGAAEYSISIFGVNFSMGMKEVIQNGLDRGYRVSTTSMLLYNKYDNNIGLINPRWTIPFHNHNLPNINLSESQYGDASIYHSNTNLYNKSRIRYGQVSYQIPMRYLFLVEYYYYKLKDGTYSMVVAEGSANSDMFDVFCKKYGVPKNVNNRMMDGSIPKYFNVGDIVIIFYGDKYTSFFAYDSRVYETYLKYVANIVAEYKKEQFQNQQLQEKKRQEENMNIY